MSTETQQDWSAFHKAAQGRPPRELLTRTLSFFSVERRPAGVAVDLGCGSGPDSLELLKRGWTVHAVDTDASGLAMITEATPPEVRDRLSTHAERLELFAFPPCDLVWASFALPFCPASEFSALLRRASSALLPGGRIAGDVFGDKHAWSHEADVFTQSETNLRSELVHLSIEAFDVEDGYRVSGGEVTRWHAFGFAARKP
jgi:tellurite methyltransferase